MERKAVSTIAKHAAVNFFFHGGIVFSVTGIAAVFEPIGGILTVEINSLHDAFRISGATGALAGLLGSLLSIGRDSKSLNPYELSAYIWGLIGRGDKIHNKRDFGNGDWYVLSNKLGLHVRRANCWKDYMLFVGRRNG